MKKSVKLAIIITSVILMCAVVATVVIVSASNRHTPQITCEYEPNTHIVYENDDVQSIRPYLTVKYTDKRGNITEVTDYTLYFEGRDSSVFVAGNNNLTVTYSNGENKFECNVTINVLSIPEYSVTFKADEQTVDTQTYTADNKNIQEPTVPTKTGYTGTWEEYTLTTGNITVNAIYIAKQYTVNFNYNGATDNNTQQTVTVTYDQSVGTLPTPAKTGYNFVGWYYNNTLVTSSTVWTYDETDAELTAKWSTDSYTVTFVADGQTVAVKTYTVENKNITEPTVPTKTGYTGKWEKYTLTTGNVTVNAVYTAKQYTVLLNYNGATDNNTQQTITVTYNQPVGELPTPTKTGYNFFGWYYNNSLVTSSTVWTYDETDAELTAKWSADSYTVTFVADGQTVAVETYTVENKNITEPTVPTKTGYTGSWEEYTLTTGNITVNAIYTPVTYTVTFQADSNKVDTQTYTVESKNITEPTVPAKTGYTGQWEKYTLTTGNITVNAVYTAKQYTVTLNYNGATGNNTQKTVTVTYNQPVGELLTPTKTGYNFISWYYNETPVTNSTIWTYDATDAELTAQWSKNSFTVTFVADGKTVAVETYTVTNKVVDEPTVPAKTGYIGEWEPYTLTSGNVTVNAIYTLVTYKVTFIADEQTIDTQTYTVENKNITEPAVPAKTGYTGTWEKYTLTTGNITVNAIYTPVTYKVTFIADGQIIDSQTYTAENKNITEPTVPVKTGYTGVWEEYTLTTGNITVNAIYTAKQYTVSLNYNGATDNNTQQTVTVTYNQSVGTLPTPTKTGYTFANWTYKDNVVNSSTVWITDTIEPITFTAQFNLRYYTVTFNSNGGSEVESISNISYGSKITEPTEPIKDDSEFLGWYKNSALQEMWNFDEDTIVEDITLYAKWNGPTEGLLYTLNDDKESYSLAGIGTATDSEIVVASVHNGKPVNAIAKDAFKGNAKITGIEIPYSITGIGEYAFSGCTLLNRIYFNAANCKVVADFERFNYIFSSAGTNGDGIKLIIGKDVTSIPSYMFCPNETYSDYSAKITSVEFEEGSQCSSIGDNAFRQCIYLTEFIGPNTITNIGAGAFRSCSNLIKLTMSDNVTNIGDNAFDSCSKLISINIAKNVTGIGKYAFANCSNLETVYYNAVNCKVVADFIKWNYIFSYAGIDGNGIKLIIGKDVVSIPSYMFCPNQTYSSYSAKITSVEFEEGSKCTSIGSYAFCKNTNLSEIRYNGSMAQWNAITKGSSWKTEVPATQVICSDGTVNL